MKNKVIKVAKEHKFNVDLVGDKLTIDKKFYIDNQEKLAVQMANIYKKVSYLLAGFENIGLYISSIKSSEIDFVSKSIQFEIVVSKYPF